MIDSEADFKARAKEIGVSETEISNLVAANYATFGKLAFACNYVPGQSSDAPLLELAAAITGVDPAPANRLPMIRRLVFESYSMAAADLRQRVERKDEDTPRRLAQAERSARYEDQKNRLIGLELTGELEPSHALIDLVYQMREDGQLRYIRWEQCTKRDQELLGVKVDPIWKPDGNGIIKEVKVQEALKAEFDTDLKLRFALQRRSLALDQSRLIDFDKFERWTQVLMEAFTSPPPDGHLRVSIEQIHRADLELFKVMMRETRGGIKSFTGAPPLEDALKVAMNATEVRLLLQPLQGSLKRKGEAQDAEEKRNKSSSSSSSQVEKLQRTVENLQGQLKNLRAKSQDNPPNRKGKGRGKGKFNMIRMPPQLIGLSPTNGDNEPICFDFNLKGCSRAKAGERCEKGWHSCMKCFKPHSQKDHQ